jgi:hypothetical protein
MLIIPWLLLFAFLAVNNIFVNKGLTNFSTEYFSAQFTKQIPGAYQFLSDPTLKTAKATVENQMYPPLHFIFSAVILHIFGKNWLVMNLIVNTFYLLVIFISAYLLGKAIKDGSSGFLIALLICCYPMAYGTYNMFSLDFPLMGIWMAAVYVLIRSRMLEDTKYTIIFALICAWGMMVKDPFGAFIIGPILCGCVNVIRNILKKQFRPLLNLIILSAILIFALYPYYILNYYEPKINVFYFRLFGEWLPIKWYSYDNLRMFTVGLWENQLTIPFFVVFCIGLYYFLKDADKGFKAIIISSIIIPNIILIFIPHLKTPRYLIPQFPALAIISVYWLKGIKDTRSGKYFIAILAIIGCVQYYCIVYGTGMNFSNINYKGFSYFDTSPDANADINLLRYNSKLLEGIKKGVLANYPLIENKQKSTLKMLVPSPLENNFHDINLGMFFWMNDIKIDENYLEFTYRIKDITEVYSSLDTFDIVMFTENKNILGPFHTQGYFTESKARYYKNPVSDKNSITEADWKNYEKMWKAIVNKFINYKIIYSDHKYNIYLYTH